MLAEYSLVEAEAPEDPQILKNLNDPISILCYNCINVLARSKLPIVVQPISSVPDDIYFKYIFTLVSVLNNFSNQFTLKAVTMALEQFIPGLFEKIKDYCERDSKIFSDFCLQLIHLLIIVNGKSKKFNATQFIRFMITQTQYVSMQHRIQLCSIMVNNNVINSNLKIDNNTLLEFC